MRVSGAPYSRRTTEVYSREPGLYNGAAVYTHTDSYGLTWMLYRRAYDRWVLDFNSVDERWSGTVAYTSVADREASVWEASWWVRGMRVYPVGDEDDDGDESGLLLSGDVPYSWLTKGAYEATGQVYNGSPVYMREDAQGREWSIYRRAYDRWVLDFNDVGESWSGTVAYTEFAGGSFVTDLQWNVNIQVDLLEAATSSGLAAVVASMQVTTPEVHVHHVQAFKVEAIAPPDPIVLEGTVEAVSEVAQPTLSTAGGEGMSTSAIAGIVIGSVAGAALLVVALISFRGRRSSSNRPASPAKRRESLRLSTRSSRRFSKVIGSGMPEELGRQLSDHDGLYSVEVKVDKRTAADI